MKNIDDLIVVQNIQMTVFQDQWLIAWGKATPETKTQMKKVANAGKKKAEKEDKIYKKAWSQNQSLDIRRLALNNSQAINVDIFK